MPALCQLCDKKLDHSVARLIAEHMRVIAYVHEEQVIAHRFHLIREQHVAPDMTFAIPLQIPLQLMIAEMRCQSRPFHESGDNGLQRGSRMLLEHP